MSRGPLPTPVVAAIPPSVPFVGPEALERRMGRPFHLRLGANESPFGPSPMAIEAMKTAAGLGQFYGDPECYDLRTVIAAKHGCDIENVVLGSGIDELLMLFSRAYLSPGDHALMVHGSYPTFEYCARSVGASLLYDLYTDEGSVDLDSLAHFAQVDAPAVVYLANPDNPSGTWIPSEKIKAFRESLHVDQLLLLDEAYSDFAPEVMDFDSDDGGLVRLRTFSKGYGMAGIRMGYALCASSHTQTLEKIRMHFGISNVAQAGGLMALQDQAHLQMVVQETESARSWLADQMLGMGFASLPSHTNFLTIDLGSESRASQVLLQLREQGVFIRKPAQPPLDGHIRVSIGPKSMMELFMEEFRRVLAPG